MVKCPSCHRRFKFEDALAQHVLAVHSKPENLAEAQSEAARDSDVARAVVAAAASEAADRADRVERASLVRRVFDVIVGAIIAVAIGIGTLLGYLAMSVVAMIGLGLGGLRSPSR